MVQRNAIVRSCLRSPEHRSSFSFYLLEQSFSFKLRSPSLALRAREFDPEFTVLRAHWLAGPKKLKNGKYFFLCADQEDGLHEKGIPSPDLIDFWFVGPQIGR